MLREADTDTNSMTPSNPPGVVSLCLVAVGVVSAFGFVDEEGGGVVVDDDGDGAASGTMGLLAGEKMVSSQCCFALASRA